MKTTNYKLQTYQTNRRSPRTINYPQNSSISKLIKFNKSYFCSSPPSVILSSIFQLDAACCMPCDTFMQKKTFACFLSIILHSTFCILFCCSVVCCLLLCGSVLCSTFWPCSAGCGRARSGLLGILVYVQQAYSLSRNKGMKHTSKVSTWARCMQMHDECMKCKNAKQYAYVNVWIMNYELRITHELHLWSPTMLRRLCNAVLSFTFRRLNIWRLMCEICKVWPWWIALWWTSRMSWLDAAGPASSPACIPELESRRPLLSNIRQSGSSHLEV